MRVVNPARGTTLVEAGRRTGNIIGRLLGLMFRRELPAGDGLLIVPCNSIHSCFMRFRFDAAFLDHDGRILHVIHAMAPWRVSRMVFKAHAVLELPAGTLRRTGTEVGDVLVIAEE